MSRKEKLVKIKYIFAIIIILFLLTSCTNKDIEQKNDLVSAAYMHKIYESSSLYTSSYNEQNGFDVPRKIIYSDTDENYYISSYNAYKNKERIDIYTKNFKFSRTIEGDITKLDQNVIRFFAFDIDNDNNIYMIKVKTDSNGQIVNTGRIMLVFDNMGKFKEEINIDDTVSIWDSSIIDDLIVTDNNFILVSSVGIQITDKKGNTQKEITSEDRSPYYVSSAAIDDNNSLYYTSDRSLKKINLSTYNEVWSIDDYKGRITNKVAYSFDDNQLCVKTEEMLSLYDTDGNFIGDICDLRDFKPSSNNIDSYNSGIIYTILYINNDTILFSFSTKPDVFEVNNTKQFSEIVKLQPLSDAEYEKKLIELDNQNKNKKNINVFLPYDIDLDRIIYDYEKINKDINIKIEYYSENPMLFNVNDYLQYVSMCINADDFNYDIISSNFIPYTNYIAKGHFINLDTLDINNILSDNSIFFTNIINACRDKNGDLFLLPHSINIKIVEMLQQPLNNEIQSLKYLLDMNKNGAYPFYDKESSANIYSQLFFEFCNTEYGNIYFNKTSFYAAIDIIKEFSDESIYTQKLENADYNIFKLYFLNPFLYEPKASIDLLPSGINNNDKYIFDVNGFLISSKSKMANESFQFLLYATEYDDNYLSISRKKLDNQLNNLDTFIQKQIEITNQSQIDIYKIKTNRFKYDMLRIFEKLNYTKTFHYDFIRLFNDQLFKYLNRIITKEEFADKIENYFWLLENEDK